MSQEHKTPLNPSKTAIARVKDPLPVPTICRYQGCGGDVRIVGHAAIYGGRTYGDWPWVYCCQACGARVGMHPFTNLPLGTLADEALRARRNECKKPFEQLWRREWMGRTDAYRWLGRAMGKSVAQCHFGLFEADECDKAHTLCLLKLQELEDRALRAAHGGEVEPCQAKPVGSMAAAFDSARRSRHA